jgi:hypothetical protein
VTIPLSCEGPQPPSSTLFSSEKHGLDVQARRNNGLLSRQQA